GSPPEDFTRTAGTTRTSVMNRRSWILAGAALALGVLLTGLAFWGFRARPEAGPLRRIALALPPGDSFQLTDYTALAISGDGREIAYVAGQGQFSQIYLRSTDRFDASPLAGTADARSPFFSPNGEWIGFFAEAKLKKISVRGGEPVILAGASANRGGS